MMPETKPHKLPHAKSYTSVYDIFGASYNNMFHLGHKKTRKDNTVLRAANEDSIKQSTGDYPVSKSTNYVTSERYNSLNRDSSDSKSVAPSTSTIFYDLDDIAKRHSFHCLTELSISNANFMKVMKLPTNPNGFDAKSNAIVQECATQIHPKLLPRDSIEINAKKVKKKYSKEAVLSSEIFLRDDDYTHDSPKNNYYRDTSNRHQKFWSYAKYRTEYTKAIPEEKKPRKKERGKHTEDPCPCQLFSYACPCTDKKSLTELAKNSKSLTVADQVTSTIKISQEERKDTKASKPKKQRRESVKEDKPTNTSIIEMIEVDVPKNDPAIHIKDKQDVPIFSEQFNVNKTNKKIKSRKRSRRVLCPNCKERVDVVISISTTEEEESLKYEHSSIFRSKEIPSTTAYAYRASPNSHRSKTEDGDLCLHEPRCELLPVCQILPTDNLCNVNHKCMKKHSGRKSTPRIIRITKACRHHPPCTVVPSCQRANVLKNNCEYIPPCLHRPRCVNLPLCVPFSKSLHYEEAPSKLVDDIDTSDCPHIPRCKYIPLCQHDSITHTMDHQINMVSRVQNACEFLNDYNTPAFLVNPKPTCVATTFSPCQFSSSPTWNTEPHIMCRSNKSCQFDSSNFKYINESQQDPSNETVIFIRDVGCQFRNKSYSPKESVLQSKVSSNSFDFVDVKMGNYFTNMHTLRYEDKCTDPLSGEDQSYSTASITSVELDSECPSHGRRANRCLPKNRPATGFIPRPAYVAAYSTLAERMPPIVQFETNNDVREYHEYNNIFPVKSRKSFLKGKYRNMFSVKRRRKSRISGLNCSARKLKGEQKKKLKT